MHIDRETIVIECDQCVLHDLACDDCVVTVLLDAPDRPAEIGAEERRALRVLADARLVPTLRLRREAARAS